MIDHTRNFGIIYKINQNSICFLLAFSLVFTLLVWEVYPALFGGFYFDDVSNLLELGRYGRIDGLDKWFYYVTSGTSGPTGRPLSLISFTFNAQNWPADPFWFKLTNTLLHFSNGLLVFFLAHKLLIGYGLSLESSKAKKIAYFCALIWVFHPIQFSAVFMVVQRMTILSAFFTLVGILSYLRVRDAFIGLDLIKGVPAALLLVLCGLMAAFAKENGILLPLYLMVIELTLGTKIPQQAIKRIWSCTLFGIPLFIILSYLILSFVHGLGYTNRSYTSLERILTQPEILGTYLQYLFMPTLKASGVFQDGWPINRSIYGWLGLMVVFLLAIGAITLRKKLPLLCFAVLWFLIGHLLESTTINLELYFEHRNYLPILGFTLLFSYGVWNFPLQKVQKPIVICVLGYLLIIGRMSSGLWSDTLVHSLAALKEVPNSDRAHQAAAYRYLEVGQLNKALEHFQILAGKDDPYLVNKMQVVQIKCFMGYEVKGLLEQIAEDSRQHKKFRGLLTVVDKIRVNIINGKCKKLTIEDLLEFVSALDKKKAVVISKSSFFKNFYVTKANLYHSIQQLDATIEMLDQAFKVSHTPDIALNQVKLLTNVGRYSEAKEYLLLAEKSLQSSSFSLVPSPIAKEIEIIKENFAENQKVNEH